MENKRTLSLLRPIIIFALLISGSAYGQCPQVFDFFGNAVDNPYWYSCSGGNFNFNLQSPDDWGEYEINWGDGTANTTGASWNSPASINHLYTATVDTFLVSITEINTGCVIEGVVVMEEATSASIQIPVGGLTQACAPQAMEFINSSTNVSETTTFTWDFGDGSPPLTFDYTNWNQVISHTYEQNTVDCETVVSLVAENYCNTIQGGPSEATFNPIRIWDIDDAAITASATLLCYPDTVVELTNTTQRNCLFQGNIFQRYEYWNFGDYWGEGQDSIIDWTPWPPTFPQTIAYPGIGTYEVMMLDSNYCGIDTAYINIQIVPPPTAGIAASNDTICVGEPITFLQQATGGANSYSWNFDDGNGWLPTGGGNITYIFNNPGTYNVCSAVGINNASGGCADTTCVEVIVQPSPVAIIGASDLIGCDNLSVDYENLSTGGVSATWTFDVAPNTFIGNTPPTIDYNSPGNYVTTLSVEGLNGCLDTDQAVATVYASPQVDFLANNVCQGTAAEFTDLSVADPGDQIISWVWDFGEGFSSFDQNPEHAYDGDGSFDVTLTVTTANCGASLTQTVSVEPAPVPVIGLNPTEGCAPLEVQFENATAGAASYQWLFGDNTASTDEAPSHTYFNFTPNDTIYQVIFTAFSTFGCSASDTLDVLVYPGAQASFQDNSVPPGCSPFDANFINTSTGASSYTWDFGDNTTSTQENPDHLYVNNTGFLQNFTVELIAFADNGCHDTTYSSITVYPTPNWEFDLLPDSGCSPLIVTMPFIQGINSFQWDFGDGSDINIFPTPTHIFENQTTDPAIYEVTLIGISPFGCTDTTSSEVWVNPQPIAQFTADINSGCSPLTVNFENLSIQADTYDWNYGGAGTSSESALTHSFTFENLTDEVLVYEVELTAISDDGCIDSFTLPIQVYPQAVASFADPGDGCSPYSVEFENTSSNGDSFSWDFGNGLNSVNENPSSTFFSPTATDTTYNVSLSIITDFGCTNSFTLPITVNPSPIAQFSLSQEEGCHPAPAAIFNTSTGATSFEWDYGDASFSNENAPLHQHIWSSTSAQPVEYVVSLTAISDAGCTDQTSIPYTVFPLVTSAVEGVEAGCAPLNVTFSNQSLGANSGFDWDFGDGIGSSQTNPSHIFTNTSPEDTTYNVMLVAQSVYGCTDTSFVPVTVLATSTAVALIDTTFGCYPLEVVFENASINADQVSWVYGTGEVSGTTEQFHTYTYFNFGTEPITYDVTLNVSSASGCTSSDQLTVNVLPQLQADFTGEINGCTPLNVQFQNQSQGGISYQWFFGDGGESSLSNPQHTFVNEGTEDVEFEVMMVAQSFFGCYDTTYANVNVYATPEALFAATPESQVFPDATIALDNLSSAGNSANYSWNMGDNGNQSGIEPADYTYDTWGEYTITLDIDNGFCSDQFSQTIEIIAPEPIANFEAQEKGCIPLTVNFENTSVYGASYLWDFGDGGTSTATNPSYTYYQAGTYSVSLTAFGFNEGDSDVLVQEEIITVHPRATAGFTISPSEVVVPNQPMFTVNLSENATAYEWDFGDETTSTEFEPVHYYQEEGLYTIQLIATNEFGCNDTLIRYDILNAIALGEIVFPNAFSPNTSESNGGAYDPNGFNNDVFFPTHFGVTEYQLQIFNKWGELLFESEDVNIGWDGYYKGELCKQDVYAWKAKMKFVDGQERIEAGDVTLIIR